LKQHFHFPGHGTAIDRHDSTPIACDFRCRGSGNLPDDIFF
jgi:hypothetical protein